MAQIMTKHIKQGSWPDGSPDSDILVTKTKTKTKSIQFR